MPITTPRKAPNPSALGAPARGHAPRLSRAALTCWVEAVFVAAGLDAPAAWLGAERLVLADALGVSTHGVARLPTYWGQLRSGQLNPRAEIAFTWRRGVLTVDGDHGLGQVVAARAVEAAAAALGPERAFVPFLIRDAGHLGALGGAVLPAAERGFIAFLSQATPPVMAPPGARRPAIGNNPIAFAAPRPNGPPLLIDFAASVAARGHVLVAAREGRLLEPGWAIDAEGRETRDPHAALAGSVLPSGGHKGLALAMIVQTLAGALTGARPVLSGPSSAAPGSGASPDCAGFGFVIDPNGLGHDGYAADMAAWTTDYLACGAEDARIPGERAARADADADRLGLLLTDALAEALRAVGRDAGIPFPE